MTEYSLFATVNADETENNISSSNNNSNTFDVGNVELTSSISVDFDASTASENANIENINSILANDTNNLLNGLSGVQAYNEHVYYQTNITSITNLNNQNVFNSQLSMDPLEQCIHMQVDPFKNAATNYSAPTSMWKNYSATSNFIESIQLDANIGFNSIQNQSTNNYFCPSNNFSSG